jgi:hypothetical protein
MRAPSAVTAPCAPAGLGVLGHRAQRFGHHSAGRSHGFDLGFGLQLDHLQRL